MLNACPFCEGGNLHAINYSDNRKIGRKNIAIHGLTKMVCSNCESESVPLDVYVQNSKIIEAALSSNRGAVSRGTLRKLREIWDISQRDASRIFGAGSSSFAKWESGQSELSTPTALLVQCAVKFPAVMEYLSELAEVNIQQRHPEVFLWAQGGQWKNLLSSDDNSEENKSIFLVAKPSVNSVNYHDKHKEIKNDFWQNSSIKYIETENCPLDKVAL